jgi:hypothetical protein
VVNHGQDPIKHGVGRWDNRDLPPNEVVTTFSVPHQSDQGITPHQSDRKITPHQIDRGIHLT